MDETKKKSLAENAYNFLFEPEKGVLSAPIDIARRGITAGQLGATAAYGLIPGKREQAIQQANRIVSKNLTPSEQQAFKTSGGTLKKGVKAGAGTASWLIPAGKGLNLASRAGLGATSGFLSSARQGEEFSLPNMTVGALAGGVLGPVMTKGVSKPIAGMTTVSPKVPSGIRSLSKAKELEDFASGLLKGTPKAKRAQLEALDTAANKQVDQLLKANPYKVTSSSLKEQIKQALDEQGLLFDKSQEKVANRVLAPLKGKVDAFRLKEFQRNLGGKGTVNKIFDKVNRGAALTERENSLLAMWSKLDDIVSQVAPEVKNITSTQSKYRELVPGLEKLSEESLKLPLGVNLPTQFLRGASDVAGRALSGVSNIPTALPEIGKRAGIQVGANIMTREPTEERGGVLGSSRESPLSFQQASQMGALAKGKYVLSPDGTEVWDPTQRRVVPLRTQTTPTTMTPKGDAYTPITYSEALRMGAASKDRFVISPDGKEIWNPMIQKTMPYDAKAWGGAEEKGDLSGVDSKLDVLLEMHGQLPATGALGGLYTGGAKLAGNPEAAAYESASSSLAVDVAAAMGLKPLSEAEVAEVRKKWLPSAYDTPEQAQAKVNALKRLILSGGTQ